MAAEILKRDADRNHVMGGVTNDASLDVTMLRVDPSTKRLLVDAGSISVGASASESATGGAVPASASYIGGNKAGNLTGLLIGAQTSANSLAVVLASDQASIPVAATLSAETTKVIGTINIAAAQTLATVTTVGTVTNLSQMNGVAITMGNGASGTGVQRVTIANDSTGILAGVTTVSTVTNLAQMNGAAITMGNGVSGTGVQRVTIANDSTGILATVSTVTNVSQNGGVAISLNAGAVDTGTRRVVQANGAGKTILSTGGSAASSGNNTIVSAGTNKLKVFAFSLSTVSTTAVTCIFQSGASGTELWRVILQTPASVAGGANLTVSPPAWLFATASATLLNLNLSAAVAVNWSVSYFDEA